MASSDPRRLIVSFIGDTDLGCFGLPSRRMPGPEDQSPVQRLLLHLAELGLCPAGQTQLLLFDDQPHNDLRRRWHQQLMEVLPQLGLTGLDAQLVDAQLPGGPNDVQALYEMVFTTLPQACNAFRAKEVLFHLSSGAWGMQSTLMLAACCLPLERARMFETSKENGVREVQLPLVLFAREARARLPARSSLSSAARRTLLDHTVVDDPVVEAAYAQLHGAATKTRRRTVDVQVSPAILIQGPTGSGKWHAAKQFARWRQVDPVQWLLPGVPADAPGEGATVLIWRLDAWDAAALQALSAWCAARPDVTVVATWRTDVAAAAPLVEVARVGLRGAMPVILPALSSRSDVVALGKAVAEANGIFGGKVDKRLQFELGSDVYARNLHDLKQVLAMAVSYSKDQHPDAGGWLRAGQVLAAANDETLLREALDILANLRFPPGKDTRPKLDDTLALVKHLVVRASLARGLTQEQAGDRLGYTQTGISEILKRKPDLQAWRRPAVRDPDATG